MKAADKFNQFAQQNGASVLYLDENLVMQYEDKEEIIFWGSVYGSEFREMPDNALTSENEYRKWCWKTAKMMPKRRTAAVFDDYVRPRMINATVRETLPGTEYGAEIDAAIDLVLGPYRRNFKDLDNGAELLPGDWVWVETLPDSKCGQEAIIRINGLMRVIGHKEAVGITEGKIRRKDVCKRLVYWGRRVDDRGGAVNRLRCAYALPAKLLFEGLEAAENKD
jgi:hypothetical protein